MTGSINAFIVEGTQLKVHVESDQGATLTLVGEFTDSEPTVESGGVLEHNPALVSNMWSYAKTWYEAHSISQDDALSIPDRNEQKKALKALAKAKRLLRLVQKTMPKSHNGLQTLPTMSLHISRKTVGAHLALARRITSNQTGQQGKCLY